MRRFILLGGPADRTCARILEELKNSPDGALSLAELKDTVPLLAGGLRRFKNQKWLDILYVELPDSRRLLFFDPRGDRLTIDDPQLGFYLRNISLVQFAREAGIVQPRAGKLVVITYVRADQRWLDRLYLQLSPLERQRLLQVDVWEENRLSGQSASSNLRKSIEAAATAISLVSADYLASDFLEPDLGGLLATLPLARARGSHIISLITRPCHFQGTGLDNFEVINPTAPLSEMSDGEMERMLVDLADLIASRIA
jgi:hypothetical protein